MKAMSVTGISSVKNIYQVFGMYLNDVEMKHYKDFEELDEAPQISFYMMAKEEKWLGGSLRK